MTRNEWVRFILSPFKAYIILTPFVFIYLMIAHQTSHVESSYLNVMAIGYIICIIIMSVGGIFTAILLREWKAMLPGLIYAIVGILLLSIVILPSLAPTRL